MTVLGRTGGCHRCDVGWWSSLPAGTIWQCDECGTVRIGHRDPNWGVANYWPKATRRQLRRLRREGLLPEVERD